MPAVSWVRSQGLRGGQAASGTAAASGRGLLVGLGGWRAKGNNQDTSNGQALWRDIPCFHPHNHHASSHYHPHFMGEETEAQTSEEKCPRLSDGTEIQI